MDKKEAIKQLEAINARKDGDNEEMHIDADRILLERLDALGEFEVVEAYHSIRDNHGFWYA